MMEIADEAAPLLAMLSGPQHSVFAFFSFAFKALALALPPGTGIRLWSICHCFDLSTLDFLFIRSERRGSLTLERRLYIAGIESALMPIGLFSFGWTGSPLFHWIAPTLAVGCSAIGIYSIYLATFNYLADTCWNYSCVSSLSLCLLRACMRFSISVPY